VNGLSNEDEDFGTVSTLFIVAGFDSDPDEITRTLGISPDEVGRAGETRRLLSGSQQQYQVPASYWEIHEPRRRVATLEGCLAGLLTRIEPAGRAIHQLPSTITKKVLIQASLGANGRAPGILLGADLLERIAALGIALEIDID
jgi:hypothetical protein